MGFTKNFGGAVTRSVGKGGSITRLCQGYLWLAVGEAPVWSDRRGDRTATSRPPFRLKLMARKVPMARIFDRYELAAADGTYDRGAPKMDGGLGHR
ncbi:hypothetical protein [Streptomyces sp. NPDC091215]|uniref:hypothetical protein n=1 Tax=Streptomyces sp. NPDC091215 TaxID=3155192 RepID=UPI00344ADEA4